jgi:NTP pyrophosphatase (non-canonical NTP hydrolase)|nr:MAG TPA_asm: NTP-PPase-like protein [Caudoviricetes sp.]
MITLNKLAVKCREIALRRRKITKDSSHKGLAIGISMEWRELFNASENPSEHIGDYSEREEEAADVIIAAMTYLQSIGCRNIEQLIKDKISFNEKRTD